MAHFSNNYANFTCTNLAEKMYIKLMKLAAAHGGSRRYTAAYSGLQHDKKKLFDDDDVLPSLAQMTTRPLAGHTGAPINRKIRPLIGRDQSSKKNLRLRKKLPPKFCAKPKLTLEITI